MKEGKGKKVFTWRINLFIFLVFSFGCMFGVAISDLPTTLDAYLSQAIETNAYGITDSNFSNATSSNLSSNATSGNLIQDATTSNASSSNASSSNASSSNTAIDNIYLTAVDFGTDTQVKPGERLYIDFCTQGNCINGATLTLVNSTNTYVFSTQVNYNDDGTTYIDIPDEALAGTYTLRDVLLTATSNYGGTFSKTYSTDSAISAYSLEYTPSLKVIKDETKEDIKLNSISFETKETNIGDKIYFSIDTSVELLSAKFTFVNNDTNENVTAYMKEESGKKYISFASNVVEGEYTLKTLTLTSSDTTTIYSQETQENATVYNFNTSIKLTKVNQEELEYNNEDITEEVLLEIENSTQVKRVIINADTKSVISAEVFGTIQGKDIELVINYRNNQYVFEGQDITESKDIDVSIKLEKLDENTKSTDIKALVSNGIVVNFASNGNLPATAVVKLKQTDEMKSVLKGLNIYVYYYDESTKLFEEVAQNVKLQSDGYYEISITHNSRYLLTTEKLDDSLIQEAEDENVVSFLMSNKVYLVLLILAFVLIVVVIVIIVVYNKNKKKNNKIEVKKEEKDISKEESQESSKGVQNIPTEESNEQK